MPFSTPKVAPPAFSDPMVEVNRYPSSDWMTWILITLLPAIEQVPAVAGGTTPVVVEPSLNDAYVSQLPLGPINAGVYRVSVYTRITTPDGAASSVQPYVSFLDDGIACTITGTAMTSNAVNAPLGQSFIVNTDAPGPISLGVNYTSTTPNQAVYKIVVTVERVQ